MNTLQLRIGFVLAIIACGIFVMLMRSDKPAFPNPMQDLFSEPIMALEFVQTNKDLDTVLNLQTVSGTAETGARIEFLRKVIKWDFPFIISYGLFLFLLVTINFPPGLVRNFLIALVLTVILSDVLENVYSLKILSAYVPGVDLEAEIRWQYRFVFLKWSLLFMLVFGLVRKSFIWLKLVGRVLSWAYGIMVIAFLIKPDYIIKSKINVAEFIGSVTFLLILILTILALTSKQQNKL